MIIAYRDKRKLSGVFVRFSLRRFIDDLEKPGIAVTAINRLK
jgi:hypothetical protein